MKQAIRLSAWGVGLLLFTWPAAALAHGFAKRYDLPIPLGFYLTGAGATVAVSFVLLALFAKERPADGERRRPEIRLVAAGRFLSQPWVAGTPRTLSAAMLLLLVVAGFIGNADPYKNITPTFIWVIWWVGMMFVNTFVGNVWPVLNPWNAWFAGAEALLRRLRPGARLGLDRPYPARLGVWPAVLLFLAFAWLELVWGEGEDPFRLARMVVAYSVLTWAGMAVFGRRVWLEKGEAFTVVFSTFARFAPLAWRVETRTLVLRPPAAGLLTDKPISASMMALVMVMLATVTFDGVLVTPVWTAYYEFFKEMPALQPMWEADWMSLALGFWMLATPPFLAFPLLFAGFLLLSCRVAAALAGGSTDELARWFALTFLPIAIAYHFAHYLAYLLLTGQYFIPTLSDPFGFGWDLFGTAAYQANIALIDAKFAWTVAIIAIIIGHVIAVYLAHLTASRLFADHRRVTLSQLPMLAVMVGYTMLSLWIIAQPTVQ
jgi:hypothetical protein